MSDNKRFWKKFDKPPENALKQIPTGRLKGKADINPQWRLEAMTEVFGPIGFGWKYEVTNREFVDCGGQLAVIVDISLFVKDGDTWSDPIYGTGGDVLWKKEKNGLYLNDDAVKMAVTDALSVAFKQLGVAAEVYKGLWDGSKYSQPDANNTNYFQKRVADLKKLYDEKENMIPVGEKRDGIEKIITGKIQPPIDKLNGAIKYLENLDIDQ